MPPTQVPADGAAAPPASDLVSVLSEPQALSAIVAVKAMPATRPDRWNFTVVSPSGSVQPVAHRLEEKAKSAR
ncbi:hypothetical protein Ate01nite_11500 [Actinoplanes teichomyceticus]|nr:hypothetical protein Ate01nite_11500 [Actinoplanes teichomyceticus]